MKRFLLSCALVSGLSISCSSTPKNEYTVQQVVSHTLKVRRPVGKGADPKAGPGGIDYESNPRPDGNFDCRAPKYLFKGMKFSAIRRCFAQLEKLKKGKVFTYRLVRQDQPVLALEEEVEEGKSPSCLKRTLPVVPVPREIFFQTEEKDHSCMSSRLEIEADRLLGIRLPKDKLALDVSFPNGLNPKSNRELVQILVGWSLSPFFWTDDRKVLRAKMVPAKICEACFSGPLYHEDPKEPKPSWP